jgi:ABC-type uncharacterized transport system, permease component
MYIFICLWKAGYGGKETIENVSYIQMIYYLLITETIALSKMNISGKISEEVKSGLLSYLISKPYNYIMYHFFNELGACLPKISINFFTGYILIFFIAGKGDITLLKLLFVLISIILSIYIDFCFSAFIGIFAFRIEDVSGINMIYQKLNQILGGLFIPLSFMPLWLRRVSEFLPFSTIYNLPGKLYIDFTLDCLLKTYKMQILWAIILSIFLALAYKRNIKYLSINGG